MNGLVGRLVAASLALLLLSGCVARNIATTVRADGGGTNELLFGAVKEQVERMDAGPDVLDELRSTYQDALTNEDVQRQLQELPAEWRARAELWEDDHYLGIKVTTEFQNPEIIPAQLLRVLAYQEGFDEPLFDDISVQRSGDQLTLRALVRVDPEPTPDPLALEEMSYTTVVWSVEMPHIQSFTEPELAVQEGNRVSWSFRIDDSQPPARHDYDFQVVGSLTSAPPPPTAGAVGLNIYGLLGVGLLALGGLLLARWRRRAATRLAGDSEARR